MSTPAIYIQNSTQCKHRADKTILNRIKSRQAIKWKGFRMTNLTFWKRGGEEWLPHGCAPLLPGVAQAVGVPGRNSARCIHSLESIAPLKCHTTGLGQWRTVIQSPPAWKRQATYSTWSRPCSAWRIQKWLHIGLSVYLFSATLNFHPVEYHKYNSRRTKKNQLPRLFHFAQHCVQGELKQL